MTPLTAGASRRRSSLALLAGALALLVLSPAAQSPQTPQQTPPPQRPTFRAEANLVRVDVFATSGDAPVLDLKQDEFQVFEDGAPQKIETFEHVVRRSGSARSERVEPSTVREANEMAADPHNGVFVLFLDGNHVTFAGANVIAAPLVRFIDNVLGPDDLVGLMRPEMAASEITFARKTTILERGLTEDTLWGRRNRIGDFDAVEENYTICYPPQPGEGSPISAIAREMILRRREKMTLDAIRDTVLHLNAIRQERKAAVIVTEGWVLYGRSPLLADERPELPQIYVSPRGTLTKSEERNQGTMDMAACAQDRMRLADLENGREYQDLLRAASEANVAFYPIDPRGLVAFDTALGGLERPLGAIADAAQLGRRSETLHNLATATDGIAVVDSNDLDRGLKRVSADLSSYYLLGYYTTNTKVDGRYRSISVKVTRPGVAIRARRGYRAPSAEDVARSARAADLAAAVPSALDAALARELGTLSAVRAETPLHLRGVLLPASSGGSLFLAGELGEVFARGPDGSALVSQGMELRVLVVGDGGATIGSGRVRTDPGRRAFQTTIALDRVAVGRLQVQMVGSSDVGRARVGGQLDVPVLTGPGTSVLSPPILFRAGPGTGGAQPAANPQFRRAEVLRAEALVGADTAGLSARLLDRTGKPLPVPVAVTERADEEAGRRWLVAQVALAPLAAGEYVLALAGERGAERQEILTAFRVVR